MGWFDKKESPTRGRLILRFEPGVTGAVIFTLDSAGNEPRSWQVIGVELLTTAAQKASVADEDVTVMVSHMMDNAIKSVQAWKLPSLDVSSLDVEFVTEQGTTWVVGVGEVGYLASEWQKVKSTPGEVWAPR